MNVIISSSYKKFCLAHAYLGKVLKVIWSQTKKWGGLGPHVQLQKTMLI